jgi:adenine-specific DNA-methyltransferase
MEASAALPAADRQKSLGAFYTPPEVANVLTAWAIRSHTDRVLDPSFGGLVFLQAAADRLNSLGASPHDAGRRLHGIDLDPEAHEAARRASELEVPAGNLLLRDFFSIAPAELPPIDALLGNPPYVRYQGFNHSAAQARELAEASGVRLTRLASSWAPFVIHATSFIARRGRLAQVLPAELLHAQYATEVLDFLRDSFGTLSIAVFENRIFPGALEEVILLFADEYGSEEQADVQLIPCRTIDDLTPDRLSAKRPTAIGAPAFSEGTKLIAQLLADDVRDLFQELAAHREVQRLGDLASVDIGVVTGANEFFVLTREAAKELSPVLLRPAVCKAKQIAGATLAADDHKALLDHGQPGLMLVADAATDQAALATAWAHLAHGRAAGLNERYKCRIREPWWALQLPKHGVADLLLTYCSGQHPRLVANEARVLNTNTVHGVKLSDPLQQTSLAACFTNSLTLLSAELVGRSYGGGVLKLEPSEAEGLLMPPLPEGAHLLLRQVDRRIRGRDLVGALDLVDPIVLGEGLGLSVEQIALLRDAGERLRQRRHARGNGRGR